MQIRNYLLLAGGLAVLSGTANAQTPYQGTLVANVPAASNDAFLSFPAVPAGKRLVVEHVTVKILAPTGNHATCDLYSAAPQIPGLFGALFNLDAPKLAYTDATNKQDVLLIGQDARLAVDSGPAGTLTAHCSRETPINYGGGAGNGGQGPWTVGVTIIGHLDDVLVGR